MCSSTSSIAGLVTVLTDSVALVLPDLSIYLLVVQDT